MHAAGADRSLGGVTLRLRPRHHAVRVSNACMCSVTGYVPHTLHTLGFARPTRHTGTALSSVPCVILAPCAVHAQ